MRYKNCEERVLAELEDAEITIVALQDLNKKLTADLQAMKELVNTIKPHIEINDGRDIFIRAYSENPFPSLHIPELYNALAELFGITELFAVDPNRAEDGCKDGSCGINYGE